jgi:phage terminase large subunit-like protein
MTTNAISTEGLWFDAAEAERAAGFFPRYLRHSKGEWAGRPLILEPWQDRLVRELFGWKRADGSRRYRTCYIEVPRKNGKSTLAAGLALYLLFCDREPGAEIYSAAADRDQAAIVFEQAKAMRDADPRLALLSRAYRRALVVPQSASAYRVLSADAPSKHGLNAHGVIFDELHAQPNRELWDVLTTSTGARRQPLVVAITTAGWDRESSCWELHDYAGKVRDGLIDDPTFLPALYGADVEDDWADPAVWRKANPSLDATLSEAFLAGECERAKATPGFANAFRRLYLNVWTESASRWLDMEKWDAHSAPLDPEALRGRECRAGLDLSTTTDLSALVLTFRDDDGGYSILPFAFCPAEAIRARSRRDRVDYERWREQEMLIATEGDVVDYVAIRAKLHELSERFRIVELAYDRWNASHLINDLVADGLTCVPVGMGHATMNPACRELERAVAAGQLHHGAHPLLRWCAANTVVEMTAAGDVKPSKAKSSERIDLVSALLMGLSRWIAAPTRPPSVYAARGLLSVEI